jgi:hypothetical protein
VVHEGGYSEVYVPFCGHEVIAEMAGSDTRAPDPFGDIWNQRQPDARFNAYVRSLISDMETALA